jgi:phage gp36-like protein
MAYLIADNLKTHLHQEILSAITRDDATIINTQIDAGIAEVKSYCSRFDLDKLFDDANDDFVDDPNLFNKVKDVVCWQILALANVNISLDLFRTRYEDAIAWLKMVQSGKADPGWPVPEDDEDTDRVEGSEVQWQSNTKRNNHY